MIRLVFDTGFVNWFVRNLHTNREIENDFIEFLEYVDNNLIVYHDGIFDQEEIHPFLRYLTNTNNIRLEKYHDLSEINDFVFYHDKTIYTMSFLDIDNQTACQIIEEFDVEIITPSTFYSKWKLYVTNKGRSLKRAVHINDFNSWGIIKEYSPFVKQIIILDPYLLSDDSEIENNIANIITNFINVNVGVGIKEVVLLTCDPPEKERSNQFWIKRQEILNNLFSSYTNLKIYLFRYPKSLKNHAREIFTPYWYIHSGCSFDYFDSKGKLKNKQDSITFTFTLLKSTSTSLSIRLKDVRDYISKSIDEKDGIGAQEPIKRRFTQISIEDEYQPALVKDYLISSRT